MSLTVAGSALRLCKSTRPVTDAGESERQTCKARSTHALPRALSAASLSRSESSVKSGSARCGTDVVLAPASGLNRPRESAASVVLVCLLHVTALNLG